MSIQHMKAEQLMEIFDECYKAKYAIDYKGNKFKDKWGFIDMISDLKWKDAERVVRYYFKTSPRGGHTREHLFYHYHEYKQTIDDAAREKAMRRQILEKMKEKHEG